MHLFKTRLKCLFRNKPLLFWTLIFPLIMSLLFNFAFKGLMGGKSLNTIGVVVVDNEYLKADFLDLIQSSKISNDKPLFHVQVKTHDEAKLLLSNNQVQGLIAYKNEHEMTLTLNSGGINQTIIKTFLDEYLQVDAAITSIMILSEGSSNIDDIINSLTSNQNYLVEQQNNRQNPNNALNYFYSLIGMALIYGGFWGTDAIINLQANLSSKGMRVAISPVKRFKLLLIFFSCAFIVHFLEIIILLLFMKLGLGIIFNSNIFLILLICAIGSLTGITYGAFIAIALKKANEGIKVAVTTITGVLGGFLAGMMVPSIKYYITTKIPILGYINPVNVIADGLYSLYYFPTHERFYLNICILCFMTISFIIGTYLFFRRDRFESI